MRKVLFVFGNSFEKWDFRFDFTESIEHKFSHLTQATKVRYIDIPNCGISIFPNTVKREKYINDLLNFSGVVIVDSSDKFTSGFYNFLGLKEEFIRRSNNMGGSNHFFSEIESEGMPETSEVFKFTDMSFDCEKKYSLVLPYHFTIIDCRNAYVSEIISYNLQLVYHYELLFKVKNEDMYTDGLAPIFMRENDPIARENLAKYFVKTKSQKYKKLKQYFVVCVCVFIVLLVLSKVLF